MSELPMSEFPSVSFGGWIAFSAFVVVMIFLDLFLLDKKNRIISVSRALVTSGMWVSLALLFNLGIWIDYGEERALNFLAGYLIEKSLSVDNIFVFLLIFDYFHTPKEYQHKVLVWGILGAIVMRALFIFFGIALVHSFHWVLYLFGLFLLYAAIHMVCQKEEHIRPGDNIAIKILKKFIPITHNYDGDRFFSKSAGRWYATPLLAALITVESTDVIFALDSIPAVMAITLDPFIIYTSNIFAIMGLRSLYFALSGVMSKFHLLKYGLAAILAFVACKMLLASFIKIPIGVALGFIALSLGASIFASILFPSKR